MKSVFFQRYIGQADAVFFVQPFPGGLGDGEINAHFFMQKGNQFVGLNAGYESAFIRSRVPLGMRFLLCRVIAYRDAPECNAGIMAV
jgi:hypothetical protein